MKRIYMLFMMSLLGLGVINAQLNEDFEAGVPAGWVIEGAWMIGTNTQLSSQYFNPPAHTQFMAFNDDAAGQGDPDNGTITSTPVDLTGLGFPLLTFEAYFIDGDYGADETAKVFVSADGGTQWEEVWSLPGAGDWQTARVPLINYIDQTVLIRFAYDDGTGWNYGFCIDDVSLVDYTIFREAELNYAVGSCTGGAVGNAVEFSGSISNNGIETIQTLDFNWSDGTNTYTETMTDMNIGIFQKGFFVHPTNYMIAEGANNISIWISNPNGMEDEDLTNDMTSTSFNGIVPKDGRGIFVEEATSTYCTWCTRGHAWMDRLTKCYGAEHFVGTAVHTVFSGGATDPMVEPVYGAAYTDSPGFGGWPDARLERNNHLDPSQLEAPVASKLLEDATVIIENRAAIWDETSRSLEVVAKLTAPADLATTGYKVVMVLVEDYVTGTGAGWPQINAYAGGTNGPMAGYENLPNPVPASVMVYNHVARELLTPYEGSAEGVPDMMVAGEGYDVRSSVIFNVPVDYDYENLSIMSVVLNASGLAVNATATTLSDAVDIALGIDPVLENSYGVRVFPNPTEGMTNVKINLEESTKVSMQVYNGIGQLVASRDYGTLNGEMILPFDASNLEGGLYQLAIRVNNEMITKSVLITK